VIRDFNDERILAMIMFIFKCLIVLLTGGSTGWPGKET
jgi:hypothetical protein